MPTLLKEKRPTTTTAKVVAMNPPVRIKTWAELGDYLAEHLTPVRWGPKGQPIYAQADLESVNIIMPDEE